MANISGIQISSGFVKNSAGPLDKKRRLTTAERLALSFVQRSEGMDVWDTDLGIWLILKNNPQGDTTTEDDWAENGNTNDVLKILAQQTNTPGFIWFEDDEGNIDVLRDDDENVILMQDKFIGEILKDNFTPIINQLSETILYPGIPANVIIYGEFFYKSIKIQANDIVVNSIIYVSQKEIEVNLTASNNAGLKNILVYTDIGKSNIVTMKITPDVIGTGIAGIFANNFNSGGEGINLWGNNWNLFVGSAVDSIDGFYQSSNAGTPSSGTGADSAYNGNYAFIERSGSNYGSDSDSHVETSNFRDLTEINFQLHKFANDGTMGDLVIYGQNPDNSWTEQYRHTGNEQAAQSDPFNFISINTSNWDCKKIRIGFENQTTYVGDICIDELNLISV